MISFEGDREFARPLAEVSQKLGDASFLVRAIPDVETVAKSEPGEAVCTVRPKFAFVRGTLELSVRVVEVIPGTSVKLLLHSKGIGSTSTVEASLTFAAQGEGTRVHWLAQVTERGGLLKMVPQGLIQGAAQKIIADAWLAVERNLGT
jgi:carbon monoxide dehydrogenase subunit G